MCPANNFFISVQTCPWDQISDTGPGGNSVQIS